jgi:hypothetical protein
MDKKSIGIIGAIGLIIQIALGFASETGSSASPLIILHMVIGLAGLALVSYLVARVYYVGSNSVRFLYFVTFLLVLVQVALGFRILTIQNEGLIINHQTNAFAILILLAISEMLHARQSKNG